jgi:hypothetical protein
MLIAPYALVNMCIAAALPGMNAVLRWLARRCQ